MNFAQAHFTSLFVFIATIALAFISLKIRYRKNNIITNLLVPINILMAGTFIAAAVLFYPVYLFELKPENADPDWLRAMLAAIQHSFRLFVFDGEYMGFVEMLDGLKTENIITGLQREAYVLLSTCLYVFAPVLTFTFLLSFFKNALSHIRYSFVFYKTAHIFSELNDKTLALAKSIVKKEEEGYTCFNFLKKFFMSSAIVFTDVIDKTEEKNYELIEEARELGAILFRKDLNSIKLIRFNKKRKIKVYLISEDENEKIRHATTVMTQYDYPNVELYVFSEKVQSRLILGVKDVKHMKVVRVNDIQNLIYHNLDTYGKRLFENAKKFHKGDGNFQISAVVVGFGRYGSELTRALSWFCQYPGFDLKIDIFDNDEKVESKFEVLYPDMMEVSRNNAPEGEDANYKIEFHGGIDINSLEFRDEFNKIENPTYIFVCLGNDSDNVEAALNIRTFCVQRGISPDIETVVYDSNSARLLSCIWEPDAEPKFNRYGKLTDKNQSANSESKEATVSSDTKTTLQEKVKSADANENEQAEAVSKCSTDKAETKDSCKVQQNEENKKQPTGVKNHKDQYYEIHMIGDLESFYSCDTVIDARWEKEGELINRGYHNITSNSTHEQIYEADRNFWQYEYNYKSSVTKAIHERLKYKLHDTEYGVNLPFMEKPRTEWTSDEKMEYSKLEHIRWNAYMRSEGFSYAEKRCDIAKQHWYITTNTRIAEIDKDRKIRESDA